MKKVLLFITVLAALVVTAPASARSDGRFVGSPTCTADDHGNMTCTARAAGLSEGTSLVFLSYQTVWACIADPSITVVADNGISGPGGPIYNGREFTVSNGARSPLFYEIIFGIDFGCADDAWAAVRYTNVTLQLYPNIDVTYDVGTVYPS
jgi:hypothetical protein